MFLYRDKGGWKNSDRTVKRGSIDRMWTAILVQCLSDDTVALFFSGHVAPVFLFVSFLNCSFNLYNISFQINLLHYTFIWQLYIYFNIVLILLNTNYSVFLYAVSYICTALLFILILIHCFCHCPFILLVHNWYRFVFTSYCCYCYYYLINLNQLLRAIYNCLLLYCFFLIFYSLSSII